MPALAATAPLATPALPLHTAGPYVAAAYIVFVTLILVYVGIMALRLRRIERSIADLSARAAAASEPAPAPGLAPAARLEPAARLAPAADLPSAPDLGPAAGLEPTALLASSERSAQA